MMHRQLQWGRILKLAYWSYDSFAIAPSPIMPSISQAHHKVVSMRAPGNGSQPEMFHLFRDLQIPSAKTLRGGGADESRRST